MCLKAAGFMSYLAAILTNLATELYERQACVSVRGVRFGHKWGKSRTLSDQIAVHFGSVLLILNLKVPDLSDSGPI